MLAQNDKTTDLSLVYEYEKEFNNPFPTIGCSIHYAKKSRQYFVKRVENKDKITWYGLNTNWKYIPIEGWFVLFKHEWVSCDKPFYEDLYYTFSQGIFSSEADILNYYFDKSNFSNIPLPKGKLYYIDYDYGGDNTDDTTYDTSYFSEFFDKELSYITDYIVTNGSINYTDLLDNMRSHHGTINLFRLREKFDYLIYLDVIYINDSFRIVSKFNSRPELYLYLSRIWY
jgi:hypothetical protein